MACSFPKFLLASVVAFVVGSAASAQDLQEAVKLIRLNQQKEALDILKQIVAKDPSNAEALELYRSVDQDELWLLLSQQGEIQKIAQFILERAKLEKVTQSRDEAAIEELVGKITSQDTAALDRRQAVNKLIAEHGEFAVPALAERLANADDDHAQVQSIMALVAIGAPAVLPLVEVLGSDDSQLRLNAASALLHIGDLRAAPAMARLAEQDDQEGVRNVARKFLSSTKTKGRAVDLYLQQARTYLRGSIAPGAYSDVVWSLEGGKLVAKDVPALIYPLELAKNAAKDAVVADPVNAEARSVLAQANLAEANLIKVSAQQGDEAAQGLAAMVPEFELAALAAGPAVLRSALTEGMKNRLVNVSVGAIEALAKVENRDDLASSALVAALDSSDKRVRYAAAMALVEASKGVGVPASDRVVDALAQAVTEESVRMIQVIGNTPEMANSVKEVDATRGHIGVADASAVDGMRRLLDTPAIDVVVIQNILPDRIPQDVIGNIKRDPRLAHVKILIAAKDVEQAQTEFGDAVHGFVQAPVTGQALIEAVNTALADVPVEPRNERAENYAKGASEALLEMAAGKTPIRGALTSLAAQLDRGDAIAVPAAKALGISGTTAELDALLAALSGSGSNELKVAVANAMGSILGRADSCPEQVCEGLLAVLNSDADVTVRAAAAAALGKAKIEEGRKAKILQSLQKVGSVSTEG